MVWNPIHILFALIYLVGILVVGLFAGRKRRDSNQYLNATGSMPLWVCTAACIAANCGSLDVIAMVALGAKYGMLACHFYWIGAIPALVVVAFWLLPAYARERYPSVLDFVGSRYGLRVRSVVALSMAAMMLLLAGVCLCAVAQALTAFLGWSFGLGVLLTSAMVLFYTWVGGFRATVYTELVHFAVVLAAVVPLLFFVLRDFGGWHGLMTALPPERMHTWSTLPLFAPGAVMDRVGLILGLGVVGSFGYWSTDFVQMQRALAVRRTADLPYVPLSVAVAKIVFAFLVVVPGAAAPLVLGAAKNGDWNTTLPRLMVHYFRPEWVALGLLGLIASLISTFANNVSGFSAVWVQSIYQQWIRRDAPDAHYLRVSRLTNAAAVVAAVGGAYMALTYHSLMEYIQMILSTFNAPLFALVALAALMPRRVRSGGMAGFAVGLAGALAHQLLVWGGLLHYGSRMIANFYEAVFSFTLTVVGILAASRGAETAAQPAEKTGRLHGIFTTPTVLLAAVVLAVFVAMNVIFR